MNTLNCSSFRGTAFAPVSTKARASCVQARRAAVSVRADSALIVNTKGGGHSFLGLYLAKKLLADGHSVTILNDGSQEKLEAKAPFSQYSTLPGAKIVWASPTDPSAYPTEKFDIVYDNNGKDMDACKPLIDHFKGKVSHYVFVGSAGAYAANSTEPMHVEGDARKAKAGHVQVENYLVEQNMPFTVFQPLYIYGAYTAKDCEQWFMDRILRDRPVPIPAPGIQLTTLSHVEDLAEMMATVPGNKAAIGQHFNLCSDRCISFEGIVNTIAKAAGKEAKIVRYDPSSVELAKGQGFPFRAVHFFASSEKAKKVLGWKPKHDFVSDVGERLEEYKASGRLQKDVDFSGDDKILATV
ncbi:hypothetical protein Ndes2526B_g09108 [Nannochloris sp. 'desiccata']|nr:hypothetical protein KSW81_001345 [Chlorella desiccata (nom. nud.)]KAH7617001.1 putative Chloroplast stem-loop binding protein of 41 kDa a, chloroplastic [Chlorella desiccata (nom. nud.)]